MSSPCSSKTCEAELALNEGPPHSTGVYLSDETIQKARLWDLLCAEMDSPDVRGPYPGCDAACRAFLNLREYGTVHEPECARSGCCCLDYSTYDKSQVPHPVASGQRTRG